MLDFQASRWLMEGEVAGQAGNDHPTGIPTGVFPTSDGHINIAASSSRVFTRFCEAIERQGLAGTRGLENPGRPQSSDRKAINAAISEITKTKPSSHWIELFEANGIPCGPINSIDQVFADPQVKHLGMATKMHSPHVGKRKSLLRPSTSPASPRRSATHTPDAGEHGDEILKSVGYTDAELEDMRQKGVI